MNEPWAHKLRAAVDARWAKRMQRPDGLTDKQWNILQCLPYPPTPGQADWVRPMDIGGRNGSGHSEHLGALVRKGFVERKLRGGLAGTRSSYRYRRIR